MRSRIPHTVYVSGPISHTPNHMNDFKSAVEFLKDGGHRVLDPLDIKVPQGNLSKEDEWVYYMKEAIKLLMDADCIYMLEGWEASKGALLERDLSKELRIPIYYASEDYKYV